MKHFFMIFLHLRLLYFIYQSENYFKILFLDADVCEPSPCLNNATCNDHFDFFNFFTCTCLAGYTGELCETGKVNRLNVHVILLPFAFKLATCSFKMYVSRFKMYVLPRLMCCLGNEIDRFSRFERNVLLLYYTY